MAQNWPERLVVGPNQLKRLMVAFASLVRCVAGPSADNSSLFTSAILYDG